MGVMSRTYAGSGDPVAKILVQSTGNTCDIATASDIPLGIGVSVNPDGLVNIAGPGDRAFLEAGEAINIGATSPLVGADSNGKGVIIDPATIEAATWAIGVLVRPVANGNIVSGEMVEIQVFPQYIPAPPASTADANSDANADANSGDPANPETPTQEEPTSPESTTPGEGG